MNAGARTGSPPATNDRVEFETLLSDVSARLIGASAADVPRMVEDALERIRAFFDADRCGLLAVTGQQAVHIAQGAYAPGVSHVSSALDLAALFPWCAHRLLVEQRSVVVSSLDDLPPEAAVDRATFESLGTRANLTLPIKVGDSGLHLVVIGWVREDRRWLQQLFPRLQLVGEVLVNSLERAAAEEAIRRGEERLERAAAAAHCGLWEVDYRSGAIWLTEETRRIHCATAPAPTAASFLAQVHPDDRPRVAAAIERTMAAGGQYDETYRIGCADGCERWIHATGRASGGSFLLGASVDVTEHVAQERKLREALAEVQRLREQLEHENVYLRKEAKVRLGPERLIGRGDAMRRTLRLADQVAVTDSTVLLVGETGTGKERFASYIHEQSRRRDRPMIRVNCSAIPAALIESELFGREKGAYTGALSRQVGRFELAHGSTIFLDEIGELPLEMQVKLLRVVEQRTIERLGSPRSVPVDVRIIAATNRDLVAAVQEGRFRQDLFYRLDVFPITVPPLRERVDDIPLLVEAFVEEFARSTGKHVDDVDAASLDAMRAYRWPGNVRELRNVIERAMIMANGPTLHVDLQSGATPVRGAATAAPASERDHLREVLQATGWRIRGPHGAAARLGLKPTTLESRLKKLGLDRPGT